MTTDDGQRSKASVIGARTLVVVVLFVVTELLLRHVGGFGQWTVSEQSERYGWRMLPSQAAWSRDLTVPEQINAAGFRDREWEAAPEAKDDGLYRVAIVGNSMTYGTSVPIEDTYGRVLERRIDAALDDAGDPRAARVMNFAVQGYVFEQMARVYDDLIAPYRPDLLVIPVHPHDITPMKPSADDAPYDFRELVMRTAWYDLLQRHVVNRWIPPVPSRNRAKLNQHAALDQAITTRPFAREHDRYWEAMLKRVDGIVARQAEHGGSVVLMTLPRWRKLFQPQLLEATRRLAPYARSREGVLHVDPVPAFVAPMQPVVDELAAKGIDATFAADLSELTYVDDAGVERPATELDTGAASLFLLDDVGHYTARGHGVIADQLAEALIAAGLLAR